MTIARASRILLIEDEEFIAQKFEEVLTAAGFEVVTVLSGQTALAFVRTLEASAEGFTFDLVILNLRQPQLNGLELCRWLRSTGNPVPILIISDQTSETDIVVALEMGADDYLGKPFGKRELVARLKALLRRQRFNFFSRTPLLQSRDITVYPQEFRVIIRGQEVNLPLKEFRLLVLLMSYPERVWSRSQLLNLLWGADFTGSPKTLDVHIRRLREKLELNPSYPEYIITVEGFGYCWGVSKS